MGPVGKSPRTQQTVRNQERSSRRSNSRGGSWLQSRLGEPMFPYLDGGGGQEVRIAGQPPSGREVQGPSFTSWSNNVLKVGPSPALGGPTPRALFGSCEPSLDCHRGHLPPQAAMTGSTGRRSHRRGRRSPGASGAIRHQAALWGGATPPVRGAFS